MLYSGQQHFVDNSTIDLQATFKNTYVALHYLSDSPWEIKEWRAFLGALSPDAEMTE